MKEEKEIPEVVKKFAHNDGYDYIEFIGTIENGVKVYRLGVHTEEEFPMPTGMPDVITLQNGKIKYVHSLDVLELLSRFD